MQGVCEESASVCVWRLLGAMNEERKRAVLRREITFEFLAQRLEMQVAAH